MAFYRMRCNLSAANFPLASPLEGRTIVVPQYDQNYEKTLVSSADADKDRGIPQVFYMHNCMPTPQGFQAISYDEVIAAMAGAPSDFDKIFQLSEPNANRFLFSPAQGKNYVFDGMVGAWASVSPITPGLISSAAIVTVAYINGQSYIFYEGFGCYVYNSTTKAMDAVTLTGLTVTDIIGITASNGYLIAWTRDSIAWSSTVDPLDFTPSLVTGAGGGAVQDTKGRIVACLSLNDGFIVYCEKNAVGAKYTGNINLPFYFKEVNGSGGILTPEQVSWDTNLTEHYVWSTVGIQRVDKTAAANMLPEVNEFLASQIFEDYDELTKTFSYEYLNTQLYVGITAISARFVVISYGKSQSRPSFTHALVYDLALKRWGKLKITHHASFSFALPNLYGELTYGDLDKIGLTYGDFGITTYGDLRTRLLIPELPKQSLGFLQQDGTVKIVNFAYGNTEANGIFLIGKFQFNRTNVITHQVTEIECVRNNATNFEAWLIPTLDGKTFETAVEMTQVTSAVAENITRKFAKRLTGSNISLLFKGAFNFTSMLLTFTQGGRR